MFFCVFSSVCFFRAFFPCITKGLCYNVCFHFVPRPASVMSLRFQNPTSFVVSGPSGVGKSYWVLCFIDSLKQLCPEIKQVVYHYEVWQAMFDCYTDKINFKQGMPSLEDVKESRDAFLILDDLMFANSEFLSKIYSVYSHHFHFSVLMTVQNLFHKGLHEISLNAKIMVLFKSCRDVNQIAQYLRQIYPKTYKNAYKNAVSFERGYLVIDLRCETHDNQRLRSGIFPEDTHYLCQ